MKNGNEVVSEREFAFHVAMASGLVKKPRMTLQEYLDTQHIDFSECWSSEKLICKKLEQYGYTNVRFGAGESDGFGPLTRMLYAVNPEGFKEEAMYG